MILNWTNSDIVTLRAATAPLTATSLLAYSSTLPVVLLYWIEVLFSGWRAVTEGGGLRWVYIAYIYRTDNRFILLA